VVSASYASHLPLSAEEENTGVTPQADSGRKEAEVPADAFRVSPGYFATMGIALLRGRDFAPSDIQNKTNAIIVNDTLARKLWPGEDPIGKRIVLSQDKTPSEIVGVVRTGKYRSLGEQPMPVLYRAELPPRRVLVVRALGSPTPLLDALRRQVQAVDPRMAATQVQTVSELMTFPLFPARTTGLMLGAAGILALILTWIGLFGIISYAVSQRTREIGVRMALGARRTDVLKLVMRQGLLVTGIGLVLGVAAALAASRLISSLLYGIRPDDPATVAAVSLGLVAAAMLACYLPARKAMRVDPTTALRYE
jgi:putative ABC transport system permease protein